MRPRRLLLLLLGLILLTGLARIGAAGDGESMLVGVMVGSREAGSLEIVRLSEGYLIPLDEFARLSGCRLDGSAEAPAVVTPLGTVWPRISDLHQVAGRTHVLDSFLEVELSVMVQFDPEEYALRFDLPWSVGGSRAVPSEELVPEVFPPEFGVAAIEQDLVYRRVGTDDAVTSNSTLAGSLAGGFWRTRYRSDFDDNHELQEYAWFRTVGRNMFLVGRQTIRLHPLLNTVNLTGAQYGWTNQPLELFPQDIYARELLPRRTRAATVVRGAANPGDRAELRVDGRPMARKTIGLDGTYEFLDVPLPSRRLSRIEVVIYDRYNPTIPVAIHEQRLRASEFLLQRGATVMSGGVGSEGNFIDNGNEHEGTGGFYQWRRGVTDGTTLEAAIQHGRDRTQGMIGLVQRAGSRGVVSVSGAAADDAYGYAFDFDHESARFRIEAGSIYTGPTFRGEGLPAEWDHVVEAWGRVHPTLDLGIVARNRQDTIGQTDYVLPAFRFAPNPKLQMRGRPNLSGDYVTYLFYRPTRSDRLVVGTDQGAFTDYVHSFGRRSRLGASGRWVGDESGRYALSFGQDVFGRHPWSWQLGLVARGEEVGLLAGFSAALLPGVMLRARYEGVAVSSISGAPTDDRVELGLNVNVGFAGVRPIPGNIGMVRRDRGAVAGRIRIDGSRPGDTRLAGVPILVDGRRAGQTDPGGSFFVANLPVGVHVIELDSENLPIELVPDGEMTTVRLGPGAVTHVNFTVRAEYGIAGRIVDGNGRPRAYVPLELLDAAGEIVGRGRTDQFGLYRIDGISPGDYRLRPVGAGPQPTRPIEVIDGFLFDQDLVVPDQSSEV